MKFKYFKWIHDCGDHTLGRCAEQTLRMQKVFSELKRVRGHYHCVVWGERSHWWLVDQKGDIIDPTADQFPSCGGEYVEWEGEEPTGKCPNCGGYCYRGEGLCSKTCYVSFTDYLHQRGKR